MIVPDGVVEREEGVEDDDEVNSNELDEVDDVHEDEEDKETIVFIDELNCNEKVADAHCNQAVVVQDELFLVPELLH